MFLASNMLFINYFRYTELLIQGESKKSPKNFTNVNNHFSLYVRVFTVMVAHIKVFWELRNDLIYFCLFYSKHFA